MSFSYRRSIHFPDTDAAGVVFFARYLFICHEAYEEALTAAGIPLATFFSDHALIVPIAKSEVSYLRPLVCGDRVRVEVSPQRLSENHFSIEFIVWKQHGTGEKRAALARTEHVCLNAATRERCALPRALAAWVDGGTTLPA